MEGSILSESERSGFEKRNFETFARVGIKSCFINHLNYGK